MGDFCAVAQCINYRKKTNNISYFRFPKDPKLRKAWIAKCHRADKFNPNTRSCTICSCHFKESDFKRDMVYEMLGLIPRKILRKGAIPSQNLTRQEISSQLKNYKVLPKADKQEREETLATAMDIEPLPIDPVYIKPDIDMYSSDPCLLIQKIKSLKSKLDEKEKEIKMLKNRIRKCKCN